MNKPQSIKPRTGIVGKYICQNGSVQFDQGKDQYLTVMMGEAYVDGFVLDPSTKKISCAIAIKPHVNFLSSCMVRIEIATLSNGFVA